MLCSYWCAVTAKNSCDMEIPVPISSCKCPEHLLCVMQAGCPLWIQLLIASQLQQVSASISKQQYEIDT